MAGRIPQHFIDDLLDRTDIVGVIDSRVRLKKAGRNYQALCPFHQEKTPSFSVNPDKQFYYCFGCGAGGNAIGFLMEYERLDFPQAVEQLAHRAGLEVPREENPREEARRRQQATLFDTLRDATQWFYDHLKQSDKAIRYLKDRGVTGATARDFRIGYAPPGWDNLLRALGRTPEQQERLLRAGLVIQGDRDRPYDRFRDRVMFPIRDQRGRTVAFGGRVLGDDKPKYLNSPETDVFHKSRELYGLYEARQAHRHLERLLVVEGYMDVVMLAQHDLRYAVATLGTSVSQSHLERLFRHAPEVVFCFDGDDAGRQAARRALDVSLPTLQDGRQIRFLFLPEGEDPDSLVQREGRATFEQRLSEAQSLPDFLFETAADGLDTRAADGQARFSRVALDLIGRVPPGLFRELLLQALGQRTGLDTATLQRQLPDTPAPRAPAPSPAPPPDAPPPPMREPRPPAGSATQTPAQKALTLLLQEPRVALTVTDIDTDALEALDTTDAELLLTLIRTVQAQPDTTTAGLIGHWLGTEEGRLLAELAARERLIDEGLEAEFLGALKQLREHTHKIVEKQLVSDLAENPNLSYAELDDTRKALFQQMFQRRRQDPDNP